jgi:tetratricopeptide (TPR) repeat protein
MKSDAVKAVVAILIALVWLTPAQAAEKAGALFEKGKTLLNAGQYNQAVQVFSQVLEQVQDGERDAPIVTVARGQAYFGKGDLKGAWKDANAVLNSASADGETVATALMLRGTIHLNRNRTQEALDDITAAIKTQHQNTSLRSTSFANRGIVHINLADPDSAISDLNQAIALDPDSAFAYAGRALANLRRDKIDLARQDSEKALSLKTDPQTEKMARTVLDELSVWASGPLSVTIPLNKSGQIFVQVRFTRQGTPHRFLLDTGATHTLVDHDLMREIKGKANVKEIGRGHVTLADGSKQTVTRYLVKGAFLYHLPLGEIEVQTFEKNVEGTINLLGLRSLANISVSIDGGGKKVEISRRDPLNTGQGSN